MFEIHDIDVFLRSGTRLQVCERYFIIQRRLDLSRTKRRMEEPIVNHDEIVMEGREKTEGRDVEE